MKKKQLTSILLAGIMILSLCVPAFADEGGGSEGGSSTGGQSTNVEYTASNNESYLLTVPANMAPGDTDNVSLTGNWPSTRTMKVSADTNVALTNSINANDKKTLTVSFNEIALAGNNNETVSATEEVSVQDITNANFGEWSGRFSYYVNSEGTGANEPVVEPINYQVPTMAAGSWWYESTENRNTITSIRFVDSYTPTGNEDETWFADKDNGTVPETQITVYRTGTEIIIAGNGTGKIMANEDSSYMLSYYNYGSEFKNLKNIDILILDTSKVTNMENMFKRCETLASLDLSSFDTSKISNMHGMFSECRALTSLDLSNFDTSNVIDMVGMFGTCSKLTSLDLSNFDTSRITSTRFMFSGCKALRLLDVSNFDTSKITDMSYMFSNCEALTSLDISNFDTSKVTNMGSMFNSCSKLTSIYVGSGWNTDAVTSSDNMFYASLKLPNFNFSVADKTNAHTGEGGYLTLKT